MQILSITEIGFRELLDDCIMAILTFILANEAFPQFNYASTQLSNNSKYIGYKIV